MNNPFAPQPSPAPTAPNPFAPVAAAGGVAAIQAAFAAQPAAPANPFAVAQPPAPAPASVVPSQSTAFAPLNPPGEAGLGGPPPAATVQVAPVAPAATVQAAESASPKRGRKPRAKADAAPTMHIDEQGGAHSSAEAAEPAAGDPRNPTRGYSLEEQLAFATTEELREALKSRGWTVTLTDG